MDVDGAQDVEIDDVSILARARRNTAFPLRVIRAAYCGVIPLTLLQLMRSIGELRQSGNADVLQPIAPYLLMGLIVYLVVAVLLYRVVHGHRIACLVLAAWLLLQIGVDLYLFIIDGLVGFPKYDLGSLVAGSDSNGFVRDVRWLPLRLFSLLLHLSFLLIVLAIAKIHVLPRFRSIRRYKALLFGRPEELSILVKVFQKVGAFAPDMVTRAFGAIVMYFLYQLSFVLAIYIAFDLSRVDSQFVLLASWVDQYGQGDIELITGEVTKIMFVLIAARLLLWVSKLCFRAAKRLTVASAARLREADDRAPVLYLRSFRNDVLSAAERHEHGMVGLWQGILGSIDPCREESRLEEVIVMRSLKIGPVIAVADPKSSPSQTGAARERLSDEDWRAFVTQTMQEAAVIVVLMDTTDNLRWEIDTLARLEMTGRAIFIFPPALSDEDVSRARSAFDIIRAVAMSAAQPAIPDLAKPEEIRLIRFAPEKVHVVTSRSATYSDYDMALQAIFVGPQSKTKTSSRRSADDGMPAAQAIQ